MTAIWLDTDGAERVATAWEVHADDVHRSAVEIEHLLVDVGLGEHDGPWQRLVAAASELWVAAALTRRAVTAAIAGDTFDPIGQLASLLALAGPATHTARSPDGPAVAFSSASGDVGGTARREPRTPYAPVGATSVDRGRDVVLRALADTADLRQVRADEFGLVRLADDRYVVVLPGVVDLSRPDLGWSDRHRSVRDLDRAAIASSRSSAADNNPYARLVRAGLAIADVPAGSELLIVGHSFGADTALDLAADPTFNGVGGYRVTHVVAAGYHSGPQLGDVAPGTEVLVLQNHRDVAVVVEVVGAAHVTDAIAASVDVATSTAALDPVGVVTGHARLVGHQVGALWSGVRHVARRADDLGRIAVGAATTDPLAIRDGAAGFVTVEPGVTNPAPGQVVDVFEGGGAGAGHDPSNYLRHLAEVDDPSVEAFLASVAAAGYGAPGFAVAVDVSVPDRRRRRRR
ncbi:MAG: hypothetical protein ACLGHQ_01610 [Acidimicrobiia bacterium]